MYLLFCAERMISHHKLLLLGLQGLLTATGAERVDMTHTVHNTLFSTAAA